MQSLTYSSPLEKEKDDFYVQAFITEVFPRISIIFLLSFTDFEFWISFYFECEKIWTGGLDFSTNPEFKIKHLYGIIFAANCQANWHDRHWAVLYTNSHSQKKITILSSLWKRAEIHSSVKKKAEFCSVKPRISRGWNTASL